MTMNAVPLCSPTSSSAQMWGWSSAEMTRASFANRERNSVLLASEAARTLMATTLSSRVSRAR